MFYLFHRKGLSAQENFRERLTRPILRLTRWLNSEMKKGHEYNWSHVSALTSYVHKYFHKHKLWIRQTCISRVCDRQHAGKSCPAQLTSMVLSSDPTLFLRPRFPVTQSERGRLKCGCTCILHSVLTQFFPLFDLYDVMKREYPYMVITYTFFLLFKLFINEADQPDIYILMHQC